MHSVRIQARLLRSMALASRWRTLAGNFALLLGSLLVLLLFVEAAARLDFARRRGKEQAERTVYTDHDPLLGWRLRPGGRARYERTEYTVDVSINALGMRDRPRAQSPATTPFRVLALGDSFLEAYTVDLEQAVTQVMERDLDRPGCPVEVLNAGVGGYGTDQELLYYRERGRLLQPEVVVLFFFHNDLLPNVSPRYYGADKPLFRLEGGIPVLANYPVKPPKPRASAAPAEDAPPRRLYGRSAAWSWFRQRLFRGAPGAYNALAGLGFWPPWEGEPSIPLQMKVFRKRLPETIERAWRMTDALLLALRRETEAQGARLLVVYIPSRMEIHGDDWELTRFRFRLDEKAYDPRLVVRRLEQSGRTAGFPVLDLTPALLRAAGRLGRRTYFTHDGHWNALGHRAAGEAVAAWLRENQLVPTCPPAP